MSDQHEEHGFAHVVSPQILLSVFGALILLTILTVALAGQLPEKIELIASLTIATIKGSLVVLFFMHMIFDKPLNATLFVFSLVFVSLFIGIALSDTDQYQTSIKEYNFDHVQPEAKQ